MRFVFTGYIRTPGFHTPSAWIQRLAPYFGVLEALAQRHEVISIEQTGYTGDHIHQGVDYRFVDLGKTNRYFPLRLHRLIRQLSPDAVIIHGTGHPLQVIQLRMMLGPGVRIIRQSHEKDTPARYKKILYRLAGICVDAFFFTSKQMGRPWVRQGFIAHENKIHEVMVGSSVFRCMDKRQARAALAIEGSIMYLWAGRLNDNKDPLTAIRAFHRFNLSCPGSVLYMIYQTEERLDEVREWIDACDAGDHIYLIGKIPHEQMELWFNAADFFISSSHFEVYGAVVPEAMSCMTIPILTDIPAFRKITGNGTCGLLYAAGDEESLGSALQKSLALDREEEKSKARLYFEEHLSFTAIARTIQDIVVSL